MEVQIIPFLEYNTKLPAQIAGGTMPDVFWTDGPTWSIHHELVEQGALLALDDYLDRYPVVRDIHPDFLWEKAVSPDGKTYWIPSANVVYVPFPLLYRVDIWDETGLPVPETLDELVDQMKVILAERPGMVGLTTDYYDRWAFQNLGPAFGYGFFNWIPDSENPGRIIPSDISREHRDFLQSMQLLRREGLLDPDFLLERTSAGALKFQAGDALIMGGGGGYFDLTGQVQALRQNVPGARVDFLPPLRGPNGYTAVTELGGYNKGMVIAADAADKADGIFEFLTWYYGEGRGFARYGVEGEMWRWDAARENRIPIPEDERDPNYRRPMTHPLEFPLWYEWGGLPDWGEVRRNFLASPTYRDEADAFNHYGKLVRMFREQTANALPNWNRNTFSPTQAEIGHAIQQQYLVPVIERFYIDPDVSIETFDAAVESWLAAGGQTIIAEVNAAQEDISRPDLPTVPIPD